VSGGSTGAPPAGAGAPDDAVDDSPVPMDFITFVVSLAASTSCHLGVSPNPDTKTCEENLPLARETIDILGMLQEKTQGNLTGEEERILSEVLYDLRIAYVQASHKT
jgi:hypothetical protein